MFRKAFRWVLRGGKQAVSVANSPAGRLILGAAVASTPAAPIAIVLGRIAHNAARAVVVAEESMPESGHGAAKAMAAAAAVAALDETRQIISDIAEMTGKPLDDDAVEEMFEAANEFGHRFAVVLGAAHRSKRPN